MYKLFIILILFYSVVFSIDITNKIHIVRVYDGDTFFIDIEGYPEIVGKNIGVRVLGIDTPELRTTNNKEKMLGYKAKEFAKKLLLTANKLELRNVQRDKYFRLLVDVYINGTNYADIMITNGYAYRYYGETKKDWEDIIDSKSINK